MVPTYLRATITRRYFFLSADGRGSLNIGERTLSFKNFRRHKLVSSAENRIPPGKRTNRPCEVLLHISGNATNQALWSQFRQILRRKYSVPFLFGIARRISSATVRCPRATTASRRVTDTPNGSEDVFFCGET